jgi:hypothetical protein
MHYQNYDDYINNPLTRTEIDHIANTLTSLQEKLEAREKETFKNKAALSCTLLILVLFAFSVGQTTLVIISCITALMLSLTLLLRSNRYENEIALMKKLPDTCQINVLLTHRKEQVSYDYLSRQAGYQIGIVLHLLSPHATVDKYHYEQDLHSIKRNIGDRPLCLFEYSLISSKFKTVEYPDVNQ